MAAISRCGQLGRCCGTAEPRSGSGTAFVDVMQAVQHRGAPSDWSAEAPVRACRDGACGGAARVNDHRHQHQSRSRIRLGRYLERGPPHHSLPMRDCAPGQEERQMEQAQNEGSELASGEGADASAPSPPAGSTSLKQLEADEAQRVPPSRRKLSDEQERELTRLYADTTMPVSEIARTLGIGESSVYRVAQRHGAALRGRQTPPGAQPAKPATGGARAHPGARAAASVAKPPETPSTPAVAGAPARVRPRDANAREASLTAALAHTERGPSGARARLRARGATLGRFRIRFLAERVVQARDIQDALRQAESFEAIEVTAVTHEE